MTKISVIAAIGNKNELGEGNKLIWKISKDLERFKSITLGHPIIMGRKTFESIGRVLPGRLNIIVSRDGNYKIEGAVVYGSLDMALEEAEKAQGGEEVFVIGGASIFSQVIGKADKLYLTKINSEAPLADAFFPDYTQFKSVVFSEKHMDDSLEYEFLDLER